MSGDSSLGIGIGLALKSYGRGFRGLLNQYPGAAAAYSFRKLSSSTTNVVRVRRSSDDAEQDFTAAEVSDGTLESFCGVGDGFVVRIYNQSGSGNDLIQATEAQQRKIVDTGSLVTEGGLPAMSGNAYAMQMGSSVTLTSGFTVLFLANAQNTKAFLGGSGVYPRFRFTQTNQFEIVADSGSEINFDPETASSTNEFDGSRKLIMIYRDGSDNVTLNINSEDTLDSPLANLTGSLSFTQAFARTGDTNPFDNKFQELVIWNRDIRDD
jgi:hypothetical protein